MVYVTIILASLWFLICITNLICIPITFEYILLAIGQLFAVSLRSEAAWQQKGVFGWQR